jgi:hypothetical protein
VFDYSYLKSKIYEKYGSNENFATALGISNSSLSLRLNNKKDFSQSEILKIMELLNLNSIEKVFFKKQ